MPACLKSVRFSASKFWRGEEGRGMGGEERRGFWRRGGGKERRGEGLEGREGEERRGGEEGGMI